VGLTRRRLVDMNHVPASSSPLRAVVAALLDLALPQSCAGCGAPGTWLCPACAGSIAGAPRRVRPDPEPAGLPPVYAVTEYGGAVRALIGAHKEHRRLELARPLGQALGGSVRAVVQATLPATDRPDRADRVGAVRGPPATRAGAVASLDGPCPWPRSVAVACARVAGPAVRGVTVSHCSCVHRRRVVDQAGLTADRAARQPRRRLGGGRARRRGRACAGARVVLARRHPHHRLHLGRGRPCRLGPPAGRCCGGRSWPPHRDAPGQVRVTDPATRSLDGPRCLG
jgi:hypothetical protein